MGEDYDFRGGSNPLYPMRAGIAIRNYQVLEDRLFRHLSNVGVQKLDFILGTHVHSEHIGGDLDNNEGGEDTLGPKIGKVDLMKWNHSSSKTQNATVFDISKNGFKNISDAFPNIPTVKAQWYQEDGFWK